MIVRILTSILFLLPFLLTAQIDRVSESDVQEEAKFLDALQFRLLEKWDEAIDAFSALEEQDPENDVILFELAKLNLIKKEDENAAKYANKAIEAGPSRPEYREFLIDLYSSNRNYTALNEQLNYFIKTEHFKEDYYFTLASNYRKLGEHKEAENILDDLKMKIGYSPRIGKEKVRIYQQTKNKRKLKKELKALENAFSDDKDVLAFNAGIYKSINERDKSIELYKKVLELDPQHIAANYYISSNTKKNSSHLLSMKEVIKNEHIPLDNKIKRIIPFVSRLDNEKESIKEMLEMMDILQEMYPGEAKVNALHGDIYFNSGQASKAIGYYEKTIKLNKNVFSVWKNLFMSYDHLFLYEELKERAVQAIDFYPNQAVNYYYAGKAETELGNIEEGLNWLEEGLWLTGTNKRLKSEMHLLQTQAAILINDKDKAKNYFEQVESGVLEKNHSLFLELSGDMKLIEGDKNAAILNWEKALEAGGPKVRLENKISNTSK